MPPVIAFRSSPLAPFVGRWLLDPLSVSRNKVVKRTLGEDGLRKLWACDSMEERARCLAAEPELAARYASLSRTGRVDDLEVTLQTMTWNYAQSGPLPARIRIYPVMKVAVDARQVLVHTVDTRPEVRGRPACFALRMNKQWLLVSERYFGRNAQLFPRSPVFRYYPAD